MIKAFIFDLDGVITDTAEFHFEAWKMLADELDIPIDRKFNEQLKGVSRMESLERILIHGGKEHGYSMRGKKFLAANKNDHYKLLITQLTPAHVLPGIKELILDMKNQGYQLGVASASHNAVAVIRSLGLYEMFNVIADAAAITNSKPAPDIFLLAARKLGVEASECIGIEDAESGIESIQRAGMFAVGVGDQESLKKADYYVEATEQLSVDGMIRAWGE